MAKFKVLQSNQWFISSVLRIESGAQKENHWFGMAGKFSESIPVYTILIVLCNVLVSSTATLSMQSYTFTTKSVAALTVIIMSQATTIFLSLGAKMQKISAVHQKFQTLIDDNGIRFLLTF